MIFTPTYLQDLLLLEPTLHGDHRGWFMETYSEAKLREYGLALNFLQDNHSFSAIKGTLRGLHYQLEPKAQTKLVRCTHGAIYDVAVDIRQGSPTYGQWYGVELSAANRLQLLIPRGFAHGFQTLADDVQVQYKVDELYAPDCDRGIAWNDPAIGIEWPPAGAPVLSDKDANAPLLQHAEHNFRYKG
jgi:dTDP-4-dehydrorhamnose 3,5-epimerase